MVSLNFNAGEVVDDFAPVPAGWYPVAVQSSTQKTSKNGDDYFEFTLIITEGEFAGRKLWDRVNLYHSKENVRAIAQRQLKSLCEACNKPSIKDTGELHDKQCQALVAIREWSGGESNEVKRYKKLDGANTYAEPIVDTEEEELDNAPWEIADDD